MLSYWHTAGFEMQSPCSHLASIDLLSAAYHRKRDDVLDGDERGRLLSVVVNTGNTRALCDASSRGLFIDPLRVH